MPGSTEFKAASDQLTAPTAVTTHGRRGAALVLALSGLVALAGSFATWDGCSWSPCPGSGGGFPVLVGRSGIDAGAGVVTALLGFLLACIGLDALRRGGRSPFRSDVIALAFVALATGGVYVVRKYVSPEPGVSPPGPLFTAVAAACALAAVAGARLPIPDRSTLVWAEARRSALALLIAGSALWSLALSGYLGIRIEPLTYAVVLLALGIGRWPARLSASGPGPTTTGALMVLYGAAGLAGGVLGDLGPGLLEAAPVALAMVVIVPAVLEVPVGTVRTGAGAGRVDAAMLAIRSPSGLRGGAFLLTGATVVLLAFRLLATGDVPAWLRLIDSGADAASVAWMLAVGLVIGGGLATTFVRHAR